MKDSLSLLAAGVAVSLAAWAFWHYLGTDVGGALVVVMLAVGGAGNMRHRRKQRVTREKQRLWPLK